MEIQNWIRGLGYPESLQEFQDLDDAGQLNDAFGKFNNLEMIFYSDGTLTNFK